MSHTTYSIAFSTLIKDKNIKFSKNWCSRQKVKWTESICYFGTRTYNPELCPNCGKNFNIIKYGVKTSRITLNRTDNHPTFLFLKNNVITINIVKPSFQHR